VIQSNPEQSKHLETARLKINGLWIDLVRRARARMRCYQLVQYRLQVAGEEQQGLGGSSRMRIAAAGGAQSPLSISLC